jgi:hypothetical protein
MAARKKRPWLVLTLTGYQGNTDHLIAENSTPDPADLLKTRGGRVWSLVDGDQPQPTGDHVLAVRAPIGTYEDGTEGTVIVSAYGWRYR